MSWPIWLGKNKSTLLWRYACALPSKCQYYSSGWSWMKSGGGSALQSPRVHSVASDWVLVPGTGSPALNFTPAILSKGKRVRARERKGKSTCDRQVCLCQNSSLVSDDWDKALHPTDGYTRSSGDQHSYSRYTFKPKVSLPFLCMILMIKVA